MKCQDTHNFMNVYKQNEMQHYLGDKVALIKSLINSRVRRGTWGVCYKRSKGSWSKS